METPPTETCLRTSPPPLIPETSIAWNANTAILMVRKVIQMVQNQYSLKPLALALSVASYLRDVCGMELKLYTELPPGQNIPPEWMKGFFALRVRNDVIVFVDCDFNSKFMVARPTKKYLHFIKTAVPSVYVGIREKLEKNIDTVMDALHECLNDSGLYPAPWRTPARVKEIYELCVNSTTWHLPGEQLLLEVDRGLHGEGRADTLTDVLAAVTVRSTLLQSVLTADNLLSTPTSPSFAYSTDGNDNDSIRDDADFEKFQRPVATSQDEPSGISLLFRGSQAEQSSHSAHLRLFRFFVSTTQKG